jgi:integrative and conjugative element protein (TIGR02256 family)
MRFMTTWALQTDDQLVYFRPPVLEVFERYIQSDAGTEAGGILLGHVRGKHLEILEATKPTSQDRRLKYFFERMIHGHKSVAERRWRESNGLVRYIGEWHTHPQNLPTPSGMDVNEWKDLAQGRSDRRPLLAVIVGRQDLYVELMHSGGERQRFTGQR